MKRIIKTACVSWAICLSLNAFSTETFTPYQAGQVPQNPTDLWNDYDPRREDLDVKVIREWKDEGIVTRYITFKVGTFKGADSRIAAYYSFPDNGERNAAFVWCHGGGQRAERDRGVYFANQGFATVDINWLGRPLEEELEENTDWGNVDPTQGPRFYSRALRKGWKRNLQPDEFTIDPVSSPRNSNWFLLVVAAKRAITFLEQQPEVNAERIGMAGYSMGGEITSMAALDKRLKAVVPFVGGSGFRYEEFPGGLAGTSIKNDFENLPLYCNTIDSSSYWPLVKCPVLFLSSSNDFNAAFDRVYKGMTLLDHKDWRISTNIHENHKPGPEQWILLNMWFNQYLKGIDQRLPAIPNSTLKVDGRNATFTITPEAFQYRLLETEIYYSYDPNCCTRFWNRAGAGRTTSGDALVAELTIHKHLPLYVFALSRYALGKEMETLQGPTSTFVLNSLEHAIVPEDIDLRELANLKINSAVFEDFKKGFRDWAIREEGRLIRTYKFQSLEFDFSNDKKLLVRIDPLGRKLSLRLGINSRFLASGMSLGYFSISRSIEGNGTQEVLIDRKEFNSKDGNELQWSRITQFDLSIIDETINEKIVLTSKEGLRMLKSISLISVERE